MTNDSQSRLNKLVMWLDTEVCERILCWHIPNETYYVITREGNRAWPKVRTKRELDDALAENSAVILEQDHLVMALTRPELLSEAQQQNQARAWSVIRELVGKDVQFQILDSKSSGRLIAEAAKKHGVDQTSVRKYLRRFWQRGQLERSVQPDFGKCGGPGKARMNAKVKLGNVNEDGLHVGIASDAKLRAHFQEAIDLFYNKEDRLPLNKVFYKMLIKHYPPRHTNTC